MEGGDWRTIRDCVWGLRGASIGMGSPRVDQEWERNV